MSERHEIQIEVNALNPVEFLACCGIFEIASRFDETALAHWQSEDIPAFALESVLSEKELLGIIVPVLTDSNKWKANEGNGKHWELSNFPKKSEAVRLEVIFSDTAGNNIKAFLDWWFETIDEQGKPNKSAWKLFSGNQKIEKNILPSMISACKELSTKQEFETVPQILRANERMTGRFGFDPRSSRNALDVGFSPNDLDMPVATYPFAELLAMFGAQNFFSTRTIQANEIVSSRGWTKENRRYFFDYSLWLMPVPIALARSLANAPTQLPENKTINFRSPRATRDKYSNLTLSFPANSRGEKL